MGRDQIVINEKIMELLKRDYNIDIPKCTSDIMKNKFNDLTTSYYLISKRKERAGIFRQQYKDEMKNMVGKKNKKAVTEETTTKIAAVL